ncbi:MAG TPA: DNA helicase, partial [Candidatus Bathyarchaeota archaeon]|nr:DNA helicase [Candidatus Bathyarchaeota archaeon]
LETHPKTGAAQLVEIRETQKEIVISTYVEAEAANKPKLFDTYSSEELLQYGVPEEWLEDVKAADEDSILEVADHLPGEAAEALLELATGGTPQISEEVSSDIDPFDHPDAQRRFRVMRNVEELERALDFPWEKWSIFLHPQQRQLVEHDFNGPARISGSAGTGKTIVALHRAVFLARSNPDARVLLTTFSETLARTLRTKLRRLIGNEPRIAERLDVRAIENVGWELFRTRLQEITIAEPDLLRQFMRSASDEVRGNKFSIRFLLNEWDQVIDAWDIHSWEGYRDVLRLGRRTRLPEAQRKVLWEIFNRVWKTLNEKSMVTHAGLFNQLAARLDEEKHKPYGFIVVDEAQDISIAQLRFLSKLAQESPNSLFFAGDLGQRIFQQPFSWKAVGVDIRGRGRILKINYRTSHQIRTHADRLLEPEITDVDGNKVERRGTISVFNGPLPQIQVFDAQEEENQAVADWSSSHIQDGIEPHEIAVFVRARNELDRARKALEISGHPFTILTEDVETQRGRISISPMHLAKGLEFRAVVVMACDDEIIPSQERIETVVDESDLLDVYNTERHLLYVACTRARDHLLVTATNPASEFLEDLSEEQKL